MALNGLDCAAVAVRYEATLADSAGWFLLHYVSRDEVDILDHGAGGFQELSTALAGYSDETPLFGFLSYRLKRVLLKYVPAGTSRLVQARISVHTQPVIDQFPSHDTLFIFTEIADFNEAALRRELGIEMTQVASPSPAPQRNDLEDIREDEEVRSSHPRVSNILARLKARRTASQGTANDDLDIVVHDNSAQGTLFRPESPKAAGDYDLESQRTQPPFHTAHHSSPGSAPRHSIDVRRTSSSSQQLGRRRTSTTFRPETSSEIMENLHEDDITLALWKPREKVFARPVADEKVKKLEAAAGVRQKLPHGMRTASWKKQNELTQARHNRSSKTPTKTTPTKSKRVADDGIAPEDLRFTSIPANSATAEDHTMLKAGLNPTTEDKPHVNEELLSIPTVTLVPSPTPPKSQVPLTPEKQRLMKALAMRRKPQQLVESTAAEPQLSFDDSDPTGKPVNVDSGVDMDYDSSEPLHDCPARFSRPCAALYASSPDSDYGLVPENHALGQDDINSSAQPRIDPSDKVTVIESITNAETVDDISTIVKPDAKDQVPEEAFQQAWPRSKRESKRRTLITPLLTSEYDYDCSSEEEAFIEELQSATFEEARRVSISCSPKISNGELRAGIPSPYSITSVIIYTSSNNNSRKRSPATSTGSGSPCLPDTARSFLKSLPSQIVNNSSARMMRTQMLEDDHTKDIPSSPSTTESGILTASLTARRSAAPRSCRISAATRMTSNNSVALWHQQVDEQCATPQPHMPHSCSDDGFAIEHQHVEKSQSASKTSNGRLSSPISSQRGSTRFSLTSASPSAGVHFTAPKESKAKLPTIPDAKKQASPGRADDSKGEKNTSHTMRMLKRFSVLTNSTRKASLNNNGSRFI